MRQQPLPFHNYTFHFITPEILPPSFELNNVVYCPDRYLAHGANGVVWLFSDKDGNPILLKGEFFPPYNDPSPFYSNGHEYLNEAIINKIMYGIGEFSGDPDATNVPHFIVMKYISGPCLADRLTELFLEIQTDAINQSSELEPESFFYKHFFIWKLYIHFACAIHNLHLAGYAHLDLTNKNAIVSPDNTCVKLIGFGFSEKLHTPRKTHFFNPDVRIPAIHLPYELFRSPDEPQVPIIVDISQDAFSFGFHLTLVSKKLKKLFKYSALDQIYSIGADLQHRNKKDRISLLTSIQQLIPLLFRPPISSPVIYSIAFELLLALLRNRLVVLNNVSRETNGAPPEKYLLIRLIRFIEFLQFKDNSHVHHKVLLSQLGNHAFFCANAIAKPLLIPHETASNENSLNIGTHVKTSLSV